jgi:hyperosmotically inducible periplasmic protein
MRIKTQYRNLLFILGFALVFASCKPSDSEIAESVKAKVSAVAPSATLTVQDGVVTLSGEVPDEAVKAAAAAATDGIKGVKSVVNNLTVPPPPPPPVVINPDDVLRTSIDSAFKAKGITGITAAVSNGEVTLTGNVKKADLQKVMQAANEIKPKKVVNQMVVSK